MNEPNEPNEPNEQVRHREPLDFQGHRLVVACPQMKSNVNISMIARSASCLGAELLITTGNNKIEGHIARDFDIEIRHKNSLLPVLKKLKASYRIVGLEQATNSHSIFEHKFLDTPTVLVIGNECKGMDQGVLDLLDDVIEIPLFGKPHSLNVAVATSLLMFEYAKQNGME